MQDIPSTFRGFVRAWYNNLEPNFIESFSDAHFSTNIPTKKTSTELFSVA